MCYVGISFLEEERERNMYLIIGGNGFLGNYLIESILGNTNETIIATVRNMTMIRKREKLQWRKCDIENEKEFDGLLEEIKDYSEVKVIFLAAYHQPDLVESNPQKAWNINVTSLSKCVNKLYFVSKLFYASTDSVYGNSIDRYHFKEEDPLNPVNIYGKNKAAAEAIIKFSGFHVVRFPFLIASSLVKGKNHFYDNIVQELLEGKKIQMFSDSYRSSLNFKTAADLLIKVCENNKNVPPILNICGDKDLSKYDIGLMIARKLQVDEELVSPILMSDSRTIFKTQRAVSTLMDNSKIKALLNLEKIDFVI